MIISESHLLNDLNHYFNEIKKPNSNLKNIKIKDETIYELADPFLILHTGKIYCFYELFTDKRKIIAASVISNNLEQTFIGPVLDLSNEGLKVSYPNIYLSEDCSKYFMIPEIQKNTGYHENFLFETSFDNFPFGWTQSNKIKFPKKEYRLITDKSFIIKDNIFYLFCCHGYSRNNELRLYYSMDEKFENIIEHPSSPLIKLSESKKFKYLFFILRLLTIMRKKFYFDLEKFKLFKRILNLFSKDILYHPTRPGGNIQNIAKDVIPLQDTGSKILGYDIRNYYGKKLSALKINQIDTKKITFSIYKNLLKPNKKVKWKMDRTHHLSAIKLNDYLYFAVDGSSKKIDGHLNWQISLFKQKI